MNAKDLWQRYKDYLYVCDDLELWLDFSRMNCDLWFFNKMAPWMEDAFQRMDELEAGEIVNRDENRMVGHYWLRAPELAPTQEIRAAIKQTIEDVKDFAAKVHQGKIRPEKHDRFSDVLVIGIGGSALGPQFVADALGHPETDRLALHFMDNTDPGGMRRVLNRLTGKLDQTLCVVISKSGDTPETRNGMKVMEKAYADEGLDFTKHAVAVTVPGWSLGQQAEKEGWLRRFPIWEWVGGRTSLTSAVGLLPMALQGLGVDALLKGAAACDKVTRIHDLNHNPAALLALMWHYAAKERKKRNMVILPYQDRLLLLSRYLQQLIMESLGKAYDRDGNKVEEGLTVYGNKGSTDQHAYVQQLREGVNDFFVTFIEVLEEGGEIPEIEPGVTAGDYLQAFLLGTRQALTDNGRESITITVPRVDARTIGVLVALFERAVGFYAELVNINAYHQPGVEAGKKAADAVLQLQGQVLAFLAQADGPRTAEQIAASLAPPRTRQVETIFKLLEHLAANGRVIKQRGKSVFEATYHKRQEAEEGEPRRVARPESI